METKRSHGRADAGQAVIGDDVVVELAQRAIDDVEVALQLLRRSVRGEVALRRLLLSQRMQVCTHAIADAINRTAIRLIHARLPVVVSNLRQGQQLGRTRGIAIRQRQLALQLIELRLVVAQNRLRCLTGSVGQRALVDVRIAVVVTADPGAGSHDGGVGKLQPKGLPHAMANRAVERRDLLQKRKLVVAQPDVDLILQRRPGNADKRRLPQQRHAQVHLALDGVHVTTAVGVDKQLLNAGLGIEDRTPAGLRGVRGEDGRHLRVADDGGRIRGGDALLLQLGEGLAQAHRRLHCLVREVLGKVCQKCKIAKRARHEVGFIDVQVPENRHEVLGLGVAVGYIEGHLAGGFDQLKDVLALLLREYSAQHSA